MSDPDTKPSAADKYRAKIARNPRFKEAPKSGTGFIIGGVAERYQLPANGKDVTGERAGTLYSLIGARKPPAG